MKLQTKSLLLGTLILATAIVFICSVAAQRSPLRRGRAPLTVLQSSRSIIDDAFAKKALATSVKAGRYVFALDATGQVSAFERKTRVVKRISVSAWNAEAIATDSSNNIYLASADSMLRVFDLKGRQLREFPIPITKSLAVLGDGNIVVASPSGGKLLHLFNPAGQLLRSFANMKIYDGDSRENEFLNRGKVLVGPADEIYFVSTYAPSSYVAKFSKDGELINEFAIEGDAVAFQQEKANGFLAERKADLTGGITVITSAAVEPATGHVWVAMNGLSTTATLYEYDASGAKLREYAFLHASASGRRNITHIKDIAVEGSSINVLSWGSLYDFSTSDVIDPESSAQNSAMTRPNSAGWWNTHISKFLSSGSAPASIPQTGCPPAQNFDCTADCPSGSNPTTVDCKAQVSSRLTIGDVVTQSNCTKKTIDPTPGSGAPGGCSQTVNFCNSEKAGQEPVTGTISVEVNCNPVPTPTPTPAPPPPPPGGGGGGMGDCAAYSCLSRNPGQV